MNLHDWIDELCDTLDIEVEIDESLILDVAKDAADNVVRRAAPITTFLLGYAAAASDGNQVEVERLAAAASELANRWDQPADQVVADEPDDHGDAADLDLSDLDDDDESDGDGDD